MTRGDELVHLRDVVFEPGDDAVHSYGDDLALRLWRVK